MEDRLSPWQDYKPWSSRDIRSTAGRKLIFLALFTLIWNGLAGFALQMAWPGIINGDRALLAVLLLPAVGIGLIAALVYRIARWRKFGHPVLTMNPYPGAIGGDLGGYIDVACAYDPQRQYRVNLSCLYSYLSAGGKNRRRMERVVWQDSGLASSARSSRGTRLALRFRVPEGLPASEKPARHYHLWRLAVTAEAPGIDFASDFIIPVFPTGARSSGDLPVSTEHPLVTDEAMRGLESIVEVSHQGSDVNLHFPAGRRVGPTLAMIAAGLLFTAVGGAIALADQAPLLLPVVFGGLGALLTLASLYSLTKSLKVRITPSGIDLERLLCGRRIFHRHLPASEFIRFDLFPTLSVGTGKSQVQYFTIKALGRGTTLLVAERLRGRREAELLLESIATLSGYARSEVL